MTSFKCEECNEVLYYEDEVVFYLGETEVFVTEQYPDWTHCICTTCHEEVNG